MHRKSDVLLILILIIIIIYILIIILITIIIVLQDNMDNRCLKDLCAVLRGPAANFEGCTCPVVWQTPTLLARITVILYQPISCNYCNVLHVHFIIAPRP